MPLPNNLRRGLKHRAVALPPEGHCTLHLRFTHLRTPAGVLRVALFNSPLGFPEDFAGAFRLLVLPIAPDLTAHETIAELPYGRYALSYYHDEHNHQRLDKNILGQPIQDYGFSNNAKGLFAAPPFSEAAFELSEPFRELRYRVQRKRRLL